jgi:hypothetical protein
MILLRLGDDTVLHEVLVPPDVQYFQIFFALKAKELATIAITITEVIIILNFLILNYFS